MKEKPSAGLGWAGLVKEGKRATGDVVTPKDRNQDMGHRVTAA